MADRKNIVTLGLGASPGKLLWFLTSGLEAAAVAATPTSGARYVFGASTRPGVAAVSQRSVPANDRDNIIGEG